MKPELLLEDLMTGSSDLQRKALLSLWVVLLSMACVDQFDLGGIKAHLVHLDLLVYGVQSVNPWSDLYSFLIHVTPVLSLVQRLVHLDLSGQQYNAIHFGHTPSGLRKDFQTALVWLLHWALLLALMSNRMGCSFAAPFSSDKQQALFC
uniref:Uncharacterized protein n=1 Tax=Opuntia streptacantha TaxID=393608 RepID=A0A7C9E999_OPUST